MDDDKKNLLRKIQADNLTEAVKVLVAINGGGIVAMLGFTQAIMSRHDLVHIFKWYDLNAQVIYAFGVCLGALTFAARSEAISSSLLPLEENNVRRKRFLYKTFFLASLTCFLVGSGIAWYGISVTF